MSDSLNWMHAISTSRNLKKRRETFNKLIKSSETLKEFSEKKSARISSLWTASAWLKQRHMVDFQLFALHRISLRATDCWLCELRRFFTSVVAATVRVDYWLIKIRRNARCSARWTKADSWKSSSFWMDGWTKELHGSGGCLRRVKKEVQLNYIQYIKRPLTKEEQTPEITMDNGSEAHRSHSVCCSFWFCDFESYAKWNVQSDGTFFALT
jgi:hypothetical protein